MKVLGWQRLFRKGKDDMRSPFSDVVARVRAEQECDKRRRAHSDTQARQQRARRITTARRSIVYQPPDYQRESWPEATEARFYRLLPAVSVLLVVVLFGMIAFMLSGRLPWSDRAARRECVANLRALEGSTALWAIQNRKTANDIPTDADLFGPARYMPVKPACPTGGRYFIGKVGEPPRCTIPGHRILR
jgi:hypothetical protein